MTKEEFKQHYAKEIVDGSIHSMKLPYSAKRIYKTFFGGKIAFNDEYYTRKEDVEATLSKVDLSDKKVYCPCDFEGSEFVKYFQQPGKCKELRYNSNDFRNHPEDWEWADVIVTNPPFSLKTEFGRWIKKYDKRYVLVSPILPRIMEWMKHVHMLHRFKDFKNTDKKILCGFFTDLDVKGLTFKEVFGRELPISENGESMRETPEMNLTFPGLKKYGKKTGFPPRDFQGEFLIAADCNVEEFDILKVKRLCTKVRYRSL
jgi:hypothetical protein